MRLLGFRGGYETNPRQEALLRGERRVRSTFWTKSVKMMHAPLQQRVQPSEDCPVLRLFTCRSRDLPGYIERMHVFLAGSYRLVPAAKYHIDATLQLFAIEFTFSCFCNYLCCGIASTKPLALPYIPSVPVAYGKHILMSMAVLLTSQASRSSILRFAP